MSSGLASSVILHLAQPGMLSDLSIRSVNCLYDNNEGVPPPRYIVSVAGRFERPASCPFRLYGFHHFPATGQFTLKWKLQ